MKYAHLRQIADFLANFKKINDIKRSANMQILINFDGKNIFFDLSKSDSSIYINDDFSTIKNYNAPFDNALKKRLKGAKITCIKCLENNRILQISTSLDGSYKSIKSEFYLEFTGRFTNAIITDENGVIIDAIRHIENDFRTIKPNKPLKMLEPIQIKERQTTPITDFHTFLKSEFDRLNSGFLANLKAIKLGQIDKKIEALKANLNNLENEHELSQQSEILRLQGTVLLANLANLRDHQRSFKLKDFDGKEISFNLDSTPKISANTYFNKAKRLAQKASGVVLERENLSEKLHFYTNLKQMLQNATSVSELEILYPKRSNLSKNQNNDSENIQNFYINEYKISIGKNEKGNIELLKNSRKNDVWMHMKDIASAHVIIKTNKLNPSDEILNFAAKICVNFSVSGAGRYEVDYTKRQNVKILHCANVNYIDFQTIIVIK
ncbi:NFACT family protein [Campylobacter sp. 9BO]|uniref:NFACT RNA binding domain-containing protein n=1 Tax=Campylobacter sp. 9BO TaxID=3424759 RepID=UPI003D3475AB